MSMFRKPTKRIQSRVFVCNDDDEDGDPEPPPPPVISKQREPKPAKVTKLLSFADEEEEEGEVFKVKKSSQSKRLIKKREKEKRQGTESNYENNGVEVRPEPARAKKKVTLEGLILSGREALAADGAGDVSDGDGDGGGDGAGSDGGGGFHRYRPGDVRAALAASSIPDAALIHAARKTRQQARELGGDYVPLRAAGGERAAERAAGGARAERASERASERAGGRLVREEDEDDDEEGRLEVRGLDLPSDKPMRDTAEAASDAEAGSSGDEWERQQALKGAPAIADVSDGGAALGGAGLTLDGAAPATVGDLLGALTTRLSELRTAREHAAAAGASQRARLAAAARARAAAAARSRPLERWYRRAQAVRAYVTDLVECLDEKMPALEALEARALEMHASRCQFLQARRRQDLEDQAQDALALAARPGFTRAPDSEAKLRRAAEREGRRRARRRRREAGAAAAGARAAHRDGDSSDDDLPPEQESAARRAREEIAAAAAALWSDTAGAWRSLRAVAARLARWRRRAPADYTDAFLPQCLPRLLAPYVRHQLILWNPLHDEDNEDFEKMDWYKCLMMYGVRSDAPRDPDDSASDSESDSDPDDPDNPGGPGELTEAAVRADPDRDLVPNIVMKVIVPKLTELVTHAWDPVCVRACVRLRAAALRLARYPGAGAALRRLGAAAHARLAAAVAADVLLPPLPPQVMDGPGGVFWHRCVGGGARLLRGALALCEPNTPLRAHRAALLLLGTLCTAAGAAAGPAAAAAAAALASTLPREAGPLRAAALRRLAVLARRARDQLDADNAMHLKALEQVRSVLAEEAAAALAARGPR